MIFESEDTEKANGKALQGRFAKDRAKKKERYEWRKRKAVLYGKSFLSPVTVKKKF